MGEFLTVRNLCKDYEGLRALNKVSFTLGRGDFLSLFGPNGAGKSTLLRILATQVAPTSGVVEVSGFDLGEEPETFRMQLGVISHQSLLYDHMSALENLVFYARLYQVDRPEQRAAELLQLVDLYPRRHSRVGQFSRGMRQRLSIARALVNDPSLLLLDEPFTGLDQYAASLLMEQLTMLKNRRRTVIMVTHSLKRGLEAATRVGILAGGQLVYLQEREGLDRRAFAELYLEQVQGGTAP
ncbi:ABC transporter ATP-binding protein [Desulfolithobacter dissulfuricans]|uniref:ABC transporter ATP-binding protein n=1 Tax=Desulfolithobacter dissulfuricans TaxID=2795293 RepID=A0A915U9V4_9BACT|nr:heme ABC exporter ATP-binding protein CcmA [Desulfolithobacter dissulfuricans]BCO08765.1 ABC transporter ATP-binding protein [Desulfolithobacter dissulfuricans]